jgi:two-component system, NarL family, sensor histidine kinase DesK
MTHATDTHRSRERTPPFGWAWAGPIFGLLWLGLPAAYFASAEPEAWQWPLAGAGLLAFAWLFLRAVMTPGEPVRPVAAMVAISVLLTLAAHDSFALLFMYAASAAAVRLPGRSSALAVAGITAIAAAALALTDPEAALFWAITGTVFGVGTLWLLIGGLLRSNAALREARAELAELAVAEERLRFARDMHDLLGHDLSLIALKAELAGKLLTARPEQAATEVADIRALSRGALRQVREAVDGYRRPTLPSELAGARVALEAAGIELEVEGPSDPLDPDAEAVLAWAVREGATNVLRHSGARHATIAIRAVDGRTELEVSDDGKGMPAGGADGSPARHGLVGLGERAHAVGGTVETAPGPAGGFRLRVSVPAALREEAA